MDSRVLAFPSKPSGVPRTAKRPPVPPELEAARAGAAPPLPGPQLVYTRPDFRVPLGPRAQAHWISQQVDWEITRRIERETATRHRLNGDCLPYDGPMQATEFTLRDRLLDALLFFGRPA